MNKEVFKQRVKDNIQSLYGKKLEEADNQEIYQAVSRTVMDEIMVEWQESLRQQEVDDPKLVYYMSSEFLLGRALGNNLINLCAYKEVGEALSELGIDINRIEDEEADAMLGRGGFGRMAACFLDSLATMGYPAYGYGIRYQYGVFRQKISSGFQVAHPDEWLKNGYPFEIPRPELTKIVKFGGSISADYNSSKKCQEIICRNYAPVKAVPYDIPVLGYRNQVVNTFRLWKAEPMEELSFSDIPENILEILEQYALSDITRCLYPDDVLYSGKELRMKQQYFFVSASVQDAVERYKKTHSDIRKLPEKVVFQLNETHTAMVIPELMRILMDEENLTWDEAWEIATKTCAFTVHTNMERELEKWPAKIFSKVFPRLYMILEEIDRRFQAELERKYSGGFGKFESLLIIREEQVRMANLAVAACYSVNGVSGSHTDYLKNQLLHDFYEIMPLKFSNKMNGITQRRFLLHANPLLADWITAQIGDGWITDLSQIGQMKKFADDPERLREFMDIKYQNKLRLARYIKKHNDIDVDPHSIFDIQVTNVHGYKRHLLNILHVMYLYNQMKENPEKDYYPRTFIYGGKADLCNQFHEPYWTIRLINRMVDVINQDSSVGGRLKLVFIENYCVSKAELLCAAADVSEQISTAGKDTSGTGNMKFMLNGALTLGTRYGTNMEIVEAVGEENAFLFGLSAEEVRRLEESAYHPEELFQKDEEIHKVLCQLINDEYFVDEYDRSIFRNIFDYLVTEDRLRSRSDPYFVLADFKSYVKAQERVEEAYRDKRHWAEMAFMNMACSGRFSSDRTVRQYADEIWHIVK